MSVACVERDVISRDVSDLISHGVADYCWEKCVSRQCGASHGVPDLISHGVADYCRGSESVACVELDDISHDVPGVSSHDAAGYCGEVCQSSVWG